MPERDGSGEILMSSKSRGNFPVRGCLKKCKNRGAMCEQCRRFDKYSEEK